MHYFGTKQEMEPTCLGLSENQLGGLHFSFLVRDPGSSSAALGL